MSRIKQNKGRKVKRYRRFKSTAYSWRTHGFAYDWQYSIARYQLVGKIINP